MSKTESFEFLNELALAFRRGEKNARPQHAPILEGTRAVLAHLQSTGRLLGDDEMRLTAEQVEDVRTVVSADAAAWNRLSPALFAAYRLRRALFPVTEPAAVRDGSDLVVVQRSHTAKAVQSWMTLDLWTDLGKNDKDFDAEYERQGFGDLWATLLGEVRALVQATTPTPAEPAEEETKAEDDRPFDLNALVDQLAQAGWHERELGESFSGGSCIGWNAKSKAAQQIEYQVVRGILTELKRLGMFSVPASSPVVPAPTQTGPWQTWQEVPDGVKYKGHTESGKLTVATWVNRGGRRYVRKPSLQIVEHGDYADYEMHNFAPFVAAEEGRA